MVLPTLRSLAPAYGHAHDVVKGKLEGHQAQVRSGDHDQGDENGPGRGILSEVLYAVLTDSTNVSNALGALGALRRRGTADP